jgi:hypothetical protein
MFSRIIGRKAFASQLVFRTLSRSSFKPNVRFYSDGPIALTPQIIEDRVMQLLKDFDKVEASKVHYNSQ